jgi:hypothetical protein
VKQSIKSHTSVVFDKISQNLAKRIIRDKVIKEWNERWAESETGLQTKKFFPTVLDRIIAEKHMVFDYKLNQILTNHGNLNSYLFRFKIKDNEYCENCIGQEDSADHRVYTFHGS